MNTGHGFVWPAGLPNCALCGSAAEDTIHVNPGRNVMAITAAMINVGQLPRRSHPYALPTGHHPGILCLSCGGTIEDRRHPVGIPSGSLQRAMAQAEPPSRESAFVAEIGDRLVFASRAATGADLLPPRMAEIFREKAGSESAVMWISGRYVEADAANRNSAYWSTADLEVGQPTVAHGPINWLHEERHIIGAIAGSELVYADREAAGESGVGNHIVALGALWPWVYPQETRVIREASEAGSLWLSMECESRAVACLEEDCSREMAYADYVLRKDTRCDHMKEGRPRRFIDPIFEGAGVIIPPVRPGWAKADARVLAQAGELAERQAAAFDGVETSVAEQIVAALITSVGAE